MKTLYGFFMGVAVAGLFAWAQAWGINKHWEEEVCMRGGGYYTFDIRDKYPEWHLKFHWYSEAPNLNLPKARQEKTKTKTKTKTINKERSVQII